MVQNAEWGPHLWSIIHICADRCGKQTSALLHMDEVRMWIHFLQLVEAILPCALCQKHYRAWRKAHPLQKFLDMRNPMAFREAAQEWAWHLHDTVNEQRSVERMPLDAAKELYKTKTTADLQQSIDKLMEVLERAKLQRLVDGAHIREWRAKLSLLRRFINI